MDTKNNSAVEGALASLPKARASRQRQVAKGDIAPSTTPAILRATAVLYLKFRSCRAAYCTASDTRPLLRRGVAWPGHSAARAGALGRCYGMFRCLLKSRDGSRSKLHPRLFVV